MPRRIYASSHLPINIRFSSPEPRDPFDRLALNYSTKSRNWEFRSHSPFGLRQALSILLIFLLSQFVGVRIVSGELAVLGESHEKVIAYWVALGGIVDIR